MNLLHDEASGGGGELAFCSGLLRLILCIMPPCTSCAMGSWRPSVWGHMNLNDMSLECRGLRDGCLSSWSMHGRGIRCPVFFVHTCLILTLCHNHMLGVDWGGSEARSGEGSSVFFQRSQWYSWTYIHTCIRMRTYLHVCVCICMCLSFVLRLVREWAQWQSGGNTVVPWGAAHLYFGCQCWLIS